ncbi:hypothetical protein AO715_03390 [Xanthomonas sp. Mitacek01]|nr:hypothetical protein AO715_03390 [Xanthomonas sp. Mitacek01]
MATCVLARSVDRARVACQFKRRAQVDQAGEREGGWYLEPAPKSVQPCRDLTGAAPALRRAGSDARVELRPVTR